MQARLYVVFRNAASSLEDEAPQSDRERGLVASPYDETVKSCALGLTCVCSPKTHCYCIYLLSEVFVNDLVGQPINVLVLVVLKFFNLFQSICLLNLSGNDLVVGPRHLQDVCQSIQDHLRCLGGWRREGGREGRGQMGSARGH